MTAIDGYTQYLLPLLSRSWNLRVIGVGMFESRVTLFWLGGGGMGDFMSNEDGEGFALGWEESGGREGGRGGKEEGGLAPAKRKRGCNPPTYIPCSFFFLEGGGRSERKEKKKRGEVRKRERRKKKRGGGGQAGWRRTLGMVVEI